jgi:hypothetical protein
VGAERRESNNGGNEETSIPVRKLVYMRRVKEYGETKARAYSVLKFERGCRRGAENLVEKEKESTLDPDPDFDARHSSWRPASLGYQIMCPSVCAGSKGEV